jgi:hypothetical protein
MANSRSEVKGKSLEAGKLQAGGKREGGKTLAQVGATGRRRGGKDQDGYSRTKIETKKGRWKESLRANFLWASRRQ